MILLLFLFSKAGSAAVLEEKYAKQIALAIDASEPGMTITLDMENALKIAEKEGQNLGKIVVIEDNIITVKLREKGGYSYSFFNDVLAEESYNGPNNLEYYFTISKK